MAKRGASQRQRDRLPQSHAVFLNEEHDRSVLANGNQMMPRPQFTQPDNGTHTNQPGSLGPFYDPTKTRMKVGNVETDLHGGLY